MGPLLSTPCLLSSTEDPVYLLTVRRSLTTSCRNDPTDLGRRRVYRDLSGGGGVESSVFLDSLL